MALTAAEIRALKPQGKSYKKADEKGLYIEITEKGAKLWRWKFRFGGKENRLSFGQYPEVSLADARQLRDEARAHLRTGLDPAHLKKMARIAQRVEANQTFQGVAEEFIAVKMIADGRASATVEKAQWYLSHLTPFLGSRRISEIEPPELLDALKKIEREGKRETAVRTRALASRVFRYGVVTSRCKADPAALLYGALSTPVVKHHAAILTERQLGRFLAEVDAYTGGPTVKLAMQLLPHVFLRPGELRQGRWEEVNWDDAIWTIPAERTKLRRPHAVPLSTQSIELLRELDRHTGGYDLMFPGRTTHLKPMSENTLNATYRRMGFAKEEVSAHGFRATASTLLNESGKWLPDAIERALAHGPSNAVRGAYARGEHWEERVLMGQWWSDQRTIPLPTTRAKPVRRGRPALTIAGRAPYIASIVDGET